MHMQKLLVLSLLLVSSMTHAENIDEPLAAQKAMDATGAASQTKIDGLSDKTAAALQEYRAATQRAESLEVYNQQLQRLIESQVKEKESIKKQIAEIDNIETGVLPLMVKMTSTLEHMVEVDVPFLLDERRPRVTSLKQLIDRADVSAGEKFRRIMEAYMVEADFGRTIEAYKGELADGGAVRTVDFLRIGRIGLYYQTLDGQQSGRWNPKAKRWEVLRSDFRRPILDGLRIARKQAPPEMLTLPVDSVGE